MAAPVATRRKSFEVIAREWGDLYDRRLLEMAAGWLDELGGDDSPDPRVQFMLACTYISRVRYDRAKKALERASDAIARDPNSRVLLAGTVFANLPKAIGLLRVPIENGLMPSLLVSPWKFLQNPTEDALRVIGHDDASIGSPVNALPAYQAPSVARALTAGSEPPRLSAIPSLIEPISIQAEPIVIRDMPADAIRNLSPSAVRKPSARETPRPSPTAQPVLSPTQLRDENSVVASVRRMMDTGSVQEAATITQQAVSMFPQSAAIRELHARALESRGRTLQAARAYLAAARLAQNDRGRQGRVERCLTRALANAGGDLSTLREIMAFAQQTAAAAVEKDAIVALLNLQHSITDPFQRQGWIRRLKTLDPRHPMIEEAMRRESQAASEFGSSRPDVVTGPAAAGPQLAELPPWTGGQIPQSQSAAPPSGPPSPGEMPVAIAPPRAPEPPPLQQPLGRGWPSAQPAAAPPPPAPAPGAQKSVIAPGSPFGKARPPAAAQTPHAPPPALAPPAGAPGGRTAPPAALPTFPCFYCGTAIPGGERTCPSCSKEQPRFLVEHMARTLRTHADAQARTGAPPTWEKPADTTRPAVDNKAKESPQAQLAIAVAAAFFGWVLGSSVICFIAFLLASSAAKSKDATTGVRTAAKVLKTVAGIGAFVGFIRGGPF